ncbi:phosphosulfolactate synthase, partial [Marivirga lumbricoides]
MNYSLKQIPERPSKPRDVGFTMAMDKGLSNREVEDFIDGSGEYVDIVKLGWATSYVTNNLKDKLAIYKDAGIPVYFGGTLFEAFVIRDQFDDYRKLLDKYDLPFAEVSDGSIELPHDIKCEYIRKLSEQVTVLSEVGSKDEDKIIPPYQWISLMQAELDAGAWKVIGESREAGNVGLFRSSGEVRSGLVQEILTKIPFEKIIWEAPQKSQQV